MYYVPQSIACYTLPEMQNFRKGNCGGVYQNIVSANGATLKMPNVMLKRLSDGTTATITVVDLYDNDITTVTPASQTSYYLDDAVNDYEMLVLGAGNWTTLLSLNPNDYYLRIEAGVNAWYTDAVYIEQNGGASFPECSNAFVKLSWTDGRCIAAGTSTDGVTPVLAYPDLSQTFFIFLQANLSQPEWVYSETGQNDAAGVFIPTAQRMAKRWKLEGFPVSESVIDALNASALFADVTIEFPTLPAFTGIQEIKVTPTWQNGGCLATYEYTFTTDYLLKQGCC